jgi:hypothetical protein
VPLRLVIKVTISRVSTPCRGRKNTWKSAGSQSTKYTTILESEAQEVIRRTDLFMPLQMAAKRVSTEITGELRADDN